LSAAPTPFFQGLIFHETHPAPASGRAVDAVARVDTVFSPHHWLLFRPQVAKDEAYLTSNQEFMTVAKTFALSLFLAAPLVALSPADAQSAREVRSFDPGWRFIKGNEPGGELPAHADKSWRALDVPHDWSIEGPFGHHCADGGMLAWLPAGIGWYRKHFTLPEADAKRRVFIEFDGVMANSDVWINGLELGKRPYGYVSFRYELTDHLNFGSKENVLAVRVDNAAQPASRWYTGAGIYRHVRLVIADPVHLDLSGPFVNATVSGTVDAQVSVRSTVVNQSKEKRKVTVRTKIQTPEGKELKAVETTEEVDAGAALDFAQDLTVEKPELWEVWDSGKGSGKNGATTNPEKGPGKTDEARQANLYQATVQVVHLKKVIDSQTVRFGIREAHFEAATGFWLNGRNMKIKGAGVHHDGGPLGAAVPLRVWERRLELLRSCGVNAIRTAHNPVAPEFLDLCDRMGFLVVDEFFDCWLHPADALAGEGVSHQRDAPGDNTLRQRRDPGRKPRRALQAAVADRAELRRHQDLAGHGPFGLQEPAHGGEGHGRV
jgi:beta-galactosidase